MKKSMKQLFGLAMAAAVCFALTACGDGTTPTATTAAAGSAAAAGESGAAPAQTTGNSGAMQIELTTAPVGMHPLKTNDAPSTYVTAQIFETLYYRSVDGTTYEPLLAESLPEFSEDGLTATIHLRKNVTFQDGTPFTSKDVAYMIDSLKDPNYGSQRPSIVETIESYECPDDNTIVLHLAYSDGVLVAKLAHTNSAIVNSELEKKGQDFMVDPTGAGTGAYEFVTAASGSSYTLKAYDGYWGGAPQVKDVVFSVVADESTAVARLQTGEADFAPILQTDSYNAVNAIQGYTTANESSSQIYYLAARSNETAKNDLMANKDFRKAIFEAIDFKTYSDTMLNGLATYTKSIVGPTLVGYTEAMEDAGVTYDPEDAKALIEANGWNGQHITLLAATRAWQQTAAVYIQSELAKVGITVDIVSEEWATFLDDAKTDDYFDLVILSWSNVTGDGQQMLEPNFSTKNGLRVKYNNAEFDAVVDASARTTVMEDRQQDMLKAVQMIQGDYAVTPLYSQNQIYCYNSTKYDNVVLDKGGSFQIKVVTVK